MKNKKSKKKVKITFFSDFKQFILRGNILELAVAVVIGGAFGKIVTSLVNDIITPLLSLVLGGKSFADLKWVIKDADAANNISETALRYGNFIQSAIDFLIIALCIFVVVRIAGNLSRRLTQLSGTVKNKLFKDDPNQPKADENVVENQSKSDENQANEQENPTDKSTDTHLTQEELLIQIRDLLRERT